MTWLENVIIKGKEIQDERLELTDKASLYFLGPNLTLKRCTLVLKVSARNLLIKNTRFIDCDIEVKQELTNHQGWVFASLKGCRIKGPMRGCDFGRWPNYWEGWESGSIEDCDFSEARLEGCRFMGCDPSTLRFPRWPCFTILDPIRRAPDLLRVKWPGLFGPIVVETLHEDPPFTMALTYHAPTIAKKLETTAEELKSVIEKFDFIVY